ncbi:MAG: hypothetical protein H0V79_05905 [Actinobacteria bacterium]|nr:hypothetical protein [Actinomycetota bacterium]
MRRFVLLTAVVASSVLAPSAAAKSNYCSPTGDYCTSTARVEGAVLIRLTTFSFSGSVRICVTDPKAKRACRIFLLRKRGSMWQLSVRWHRHFPNGGPGVYRVRFFKQSTQLGPVLDFRLR